MSESAEQVLREVVEHTVRTDADSDHEFRDDAGNMDDFLVDLDPDFCDFSSSEVGSDSDCQSEAELEIRRRSRRSASCFACPSTLRTRSRGRGAVRGRGNTSNARSRDSARSRSRSRGGNVRARGGRAGARVVDRQRDDSLFKWELCNFDDPYDPHDWLPSYSQKEAHRKGTHKRHYES
jgi:hypothetical protein